MSIKATAHIVINNQNIFLNGKNLTSEYLNEKDNINLTSIYKKMEISYPKFYKMDTLSKAGFIASELLKSEMDLSIYKDDEIAMVFLNSSSCLDADLEHNKRVSTPELAASPAVFVYTLPNIVLGEISIRNKWYGENLFNIAESFDAEKWLETVRLLFSKNKAKAVLGGWLEAANGKLDIRLFFMEKDQQKAQFEIN